MPEVIVIGGANLDVKGKSAGDFVPRTSNPGRVVTTVGGVARNIAGNLAHLDVTAALISAVGSDEAGRRILDVTRETGVDVTMVKRVAGASGNYLAVFDDRGELVAAISDMTCLEALTVADLEAQARRLQSASLIAADCNLAVECLDWLFVFAGENRIRLLIEPVSVPKVQKLKQLKPGLQVFAITPNADQFAALTGGTPDDPGAIATLHAMGYANIVVHRGAAGTIVSDGVTRPTTIPAQAMGAIADVTGAGDAAVAGLICGFLEGCDLVQSARLGQAAAAIRIASAASVSPGLNRVSVFSLAGIP
ncbi:MAG: carbohydrate kinase family protein [Hyphomicrobiales bacterium]